MTKRTPAVVRVPIGASAVDYKPGSAQRKRDAENAAARASNTPERRAHIDSIVDKMVAHWNRPLEPGERGYKGPADADGQQRALTKLVDQEARKAVEGDTDSNHDNIEAAE